MFHLYLSCCQSAQNTRRIRVGSRLGHPGLGVPRTRTGRDFRDDQSRRDSTKSIHLSRSKWTVWLYPETKVMWYPLVQDSSVNASLCSRHEDCRKGETVHLGNGVLTGKCVPGAKNKSVCEVEAWCPIQPSSQQPYSWINTILANLRHLKWNGLVNYVYFFLVFFSPLSCENDSITDVVLPSSQYVLMETNITFSK